MKRVRDAFSRHGQWHLVAFLKEVGCASPSQLEPVSQAQFDRVKDNGLRALHPANQQGGPLRPASHTVSYRTLTRVYGLEVLGWLYDEARWQDAGQRLTDW